MWGGRSIGPNIIVHRIFLADARALTIHPPVRINTGRVGPRALQPLHARQPPLLPVCSSFCSLACARVYAYVYALTSTDDSIPHRVKQTLYLPTHPHHPTPSFPHHQLTTTYRVNPTNPDWYAKYTFNLREGLECCSTESISFHYVKGASLSLCSSLCVRACVRSEASGCNALPC